MCLGARWEFGKSRANSITLAWNAFSLAAFAGYVLLASLSAAQSCLLATWVVLGTGRLIWRFCAAICIGEILFVIVALVGNPRFLEILMDLLLFGTAFLVLMPASVLLWVWPLLVRGVKLGRCSETEAFVELSSRFSLLYILGATMAVACFFTASGRHIDQGLLSGFLSLSIVEASLAAPSAFGLQRRAAIGSGEVSSHRL